LDASKIKMTQLCVHGNIPELKLKHLKYKEEMYVDQMYFSTEGEYTGKKMNLTGVIEVAHGICEQKIMDHPFQTDSVLWEPFRKIGGQWQFNSHKEKKTIETPITTFRKQLVREIRLSRPGGKGDLCSYLAKNVQRAQSGLYGRVVNGYMDIHHGVQITCSKCRAIRALPWPLLMGYVRYDEDHGRYIQTKPLTKQNVCHLIEGMENKSILGEYDFKSMDVPEGLKGTLEWCYDTGSAHCYNCGWHLAEAEREYSCDPIVETIPYNDYGINKMLLEEFELCLNLDTPPPPDLSMSNQLYRDFINTSITKRLAKMDANYNNMWYNNNYDVMDQVLNGRTTVQLLSRQRIANISLFNHEIEEMFIMTEFSQLVTSDVVVQPSSINVYHGVYDFMHATTNSYWFTQANMVFDLKDMPMDPIVLHSAHESSAVELRSGMYILHLNSNAIDDLPISEGCYLLPVTGSDVPTKWNVALSDVLSKNSVIQLDDGIYELLTVKATTTFVITTIGKKKKRNMRVLAGRSKIKVLLPTVHLNSVFQTFGIIGTKWEYQYIDTELVYRIIINGMSGEKSIDSLLTYISGLTSTRYAVGGQLVDLSNIEIKNGIPELMYALILLSDAKSARAWATFNYLNYNSAGVTTSIYEVLLTKAVRLCQLVSPDTFSAINDFMTTNFKTMFMRDSAVLLEQTTAKFQDIQPYIIIEGVGVVSNSTANKKVCLHHASTCVHKGSKQCACCGSNFDGEGGYCSCCTPVSLKESTHACNHPCLNLHVHSCSTYLSKGYCQHTSICGCCKRKLCKDNCDCCFDVNYCQVIKDTKGITTVKKSVSAQPNAPDKNKVARNLTTRIKPGVAKTTNRFSSGTKVNKIKIEEEHLTLRNVTNLETSGFFHVSNTGNFYCMYAPMLGSISLAVEPLEPIDINLPIDVETSCLLHAICAQTNLNINSIQSVIGYKSSHTVVDAIEIAESFGLNLLVQTTTKTATLIRNGSVEQKYLLIAHSSSITNNKRSLGHWFVPHKITLQEMPRGVWYNADWSMYEVSDLLTFDTFYDPPDVVLAKTNNIVDRIRATATMGAHSLRDVKVTDVDGAVFLSNSNQHKPIEGKFNIQIPTSVEQLAIDAFNMTEVSVEILATSATYDVNTPLLEVFEEQLKSQLRYIALFKDSVRNMTANIKMHYEPDEKPPVLLLQNSLGVYKSMEMITMVSIDGEKSVQLVNKMHGACYVSNPYADRLSHMIVYVVSYSSMLRRLMTLIYAMQNYEKYLTCQIKTNITGIPGCGKTYLTKQHKNIGDIVYVCKFSRAKDAMAEAGFRSTYTAENYIIRRTQANEVVLDEAAACDMSEFVAMCNTHNMIWHLYGDPDQITTTDFSETPGNTIDQSVQLRVTSNMKSLSVSQRYGEPFLSDIMRLNYPLATVGEHVSWQTNYNLAHAHELSEVIKLALTTSVDLIVCFHKEVYYALSKLTSTIRVVRVHADQGVEADNVMVVYWSTSSAPAPTGILLNRKYVNTALSRCRKQLTVITNFESVTKVQDLIHNCTQGFGNNDNLINVQGMCLNRSLSMIEKEIVTNYFNERFTKVDRIEFENDRLTAKVSVKGININFSVDHTGCWGNDQRTKGLLTIGSSVVKDHLMRINKIVKAVSSDSSLSSQSTSLSTTNPPNSTRDLVVTTDSGTITIVDANSDEDVFHDALECLQFTDEDVLPTEVSVTSEGEKSTGVSSLEDTISSTLSNFNKKQICLTYKLTRLVWVRLVVLADACLLNQRANTNLKLIVNGEPFNVSIFDGCSLFCGYKFTNLMTEETVIISGAHTVNTEDLVTIMSSQVRAFVGSNNSIKKLFSILEDPCSTLFPAEILVPLSRRILERIKVVVKSKLKTTCGKPMDAGYFYRNANADFYAKFTAEVQQSQEIITHQRVSKLLYCEGDYVLMYPNKVIVTSLNSVMQLMKGINGLENEIVNASNLKRMDDILYKKLMSEQTEKKVLNVNKSVWENWQSVLSPMIYEYNVNPVNNVSHDDTIAPIMNGISLLYFSKVLRFSKIDVIGVDAGTILLHNELQFRALSSDLPIIQRRYLETATLKYKDSLERLLPTISGTHLSKVKNDLATLEATGGFLRDGRLFNTLFIGLGYSPPKAYGQYEHIYFVKMRHCSGATQSYNGKLVLIGDNGRTIDDWYHSKECVEIMSIGPMTLCKLVSSRDLVCRFSNFVAEGTRRFNLKGRKNQTIDIPNDLFKKLLSRSLMEETKLSDMIAYCRSIASTVIYTRKGKYNRYNINHDDLTLYCIVALNVSNRHRQFYKSVMSMTSENNDTNAVDMLKNLIGKKLLTHGFNWLMENDVVELVSEYLERFLSEQEGNILHSLSHMMADLHVTEVRPEVFYCKKSNDSQDTGESEETTNDVDTFKEGGNGDGKIDGNDDAFNGGGFQERKDDSDEENSDSEDVKDLKGVRFVAGDVENAPTEQNTMTAITRDVGITTNADGTQLNTSETTTVGTTLNINRIKSAVVIQKWWVGVVASKMITPPHNPNCSTCPKISRSQYVKINSSLRDMFKTFLSVMQGFPDAKFTLCRGTLLAAFYYGRMVYFNSTGFSHWVDGDIDVVVYSESDITDALFRNLSKALKCARMHRGENKICAFLKYGLYGNVDMRKCPTVHPHHQKRNKIMSHTCLDVAVFQVKDNKIQVQNQDLSEQLGLPVGTYDSSQLLPTQDIGVEFYGTKIMLPKKWWLSMSYTANVYKQSVYANLAYPWFPGVETAGSARCNNLVFTDTAEEERWILKYKMLLEANGSNMLKLLTKTTPFNLPGRMRMYVAVIIAGSEGDRVPMMGFAEVLSEISTVTIFKPADIEVDLNVAKIDYVRSYKPLVSGYSGEVKLVSVVNEMIKNVKGTFDYVFAPHFAREAYLLRSRIKHVTVYPLLRTNMTNLFNSITTLVKTLTHKPKEIKIVQSIWSELQSSYENVGLPLSKKCLDIDTTTNRVLQLSIAKNHKYHLITFGSMTGESVTRAIKRLVSKSTEPIILVRGYSDSRLVLKKQNVLYDGTHELFNDEFIVVNKVNYNAITHILSEVTCHGGAGTIQTFYSNCVKINIIPQAYDQFENAEWLSKAKAIVPSSTINYPKEINVFRKNVAAIIGAEVPNVTLTRVDQGFYSNHVEKNLEQLSTTITKYNVKYELLRAIVVSSNCVLVALSFCLGDDSAQYKRVEKLYNEFIDQRPIESLEDIILLILAAQVNVSVIDGQTSTLYCLAVHRVVNERCLLINPQLTHASFAKVTEKTIIPPAASQSWSSVLESSSIINSYHFTMSLHSSLHAPIEGFKPLVDPEALQSINIVKRKPLASLWKVLLRTYSNGRVVHPVSGAGIIVLETHNIQSGCLYRCYGSQGWFNAISFSTKGAQSTVLYHGNDKIENVVFLLKMGNLKTIKELKDIVPLVGTVSCALNAATKLKAASLNLLLTHVGSHNTQHLYIHSTFNRKHHFEAERECILTAKRISTLVRELSSSEVAMLKYKRTPRVIVLNSQIALGIEVSGTCNVTNDFLRKQIGLQQHTSSNLWITKDVQKVDDLTELFVIDDLEWETHKYYYNSSVDYGDVTTIQQLFLKSRTNMLGSSIKTWMDASNTTVFDAENLHVRLTSMVKPLKFWRTVKAHEIFCDYPFVYVADKALVYELITPGYGIVEVGEVQQIDELQSWNDVQSKLDKKFENKFSMQLNSVSDERTSSDMMNISSLVPFTGEALKMRSLNCPELQGEARIIEVKQSDSGSVTVELIKIDDVPDMKSQDYWQTFGTLMEPIIHLPTNSSFKIKSRLEPTKVKVSTKLRMENYPTIARPSMTIGAFSTFNSISERQGAVQYYDSVNKNPSNPALEYDLFKANYFKLDFATMFKRYKSKQITLNEVLSYKWCKDHNYPSRVLESLKKLFQDGFETNPINGIRAHGKTEQTTRLNKVSRWMTEVMTRSILASAYCISALFCPIFTEIKKRLKDCFHEKVCYTDGMSPNQLSGHARTYGFSKYVIEDDLSKQDAQTSHLTIDTEMLLYYDLGLEPGTLELYSWMHKKWSWKSAGASGIWDAMRLTGQPTTALGNAITNLIVHNRFYARNKDKIRLMYVLGDDNIMFCDGHLNVSMHGTETKTIYNIVSKVSQREFVGEYLSMLGHTLGGTITFCPNFKRLRHRYSVCNYSFAEAERQEKIAMRNLSYYLMLGNISTAAKVISDNNMSSNDWYDVNLAIKANALYHDEPEEVVMRDIGTLLHMMSESTTLKSTAPMWVAADNKTNIPLSKIMNFNQEFS
jgi:hypothetical protein